MLTAVDMHVISAATLNGLDSQERLVRYLKILLNVFHKLYKFSVPLCCLHNEQKMCSIKADKRYIYIHVIMSFSAYSVKGSSVCCYE